MTVLARVLTSIALRLLASQPPTFMLLVTEIIAQPQISTEDFAAGWLQCSATYHDLFLLRRANR